MEMHQIRYFLALCEKRSFTQAAQLTHVSQPSLTQAIQKLEKEFGGDLFKRERNRCELTPLGRMVEPNLRKIYQDALHTKAEAVRFTRLEKIPLRVGLMVTVGARRLSPLLAQYQTEYPNAELELIVDQENTLLKQLQSGALDMVISAPLKLPGKPLQSRMLYEERYVVAFGRNHRFNDLEEVDLAAIQSEPYLDRLNCELRETLKSICTDREIDLYAAYRSNNEEWILHMVRAGLGVALMPEYTIPMYSDDIGYKYLTEPVISRRVCAIYSRPSYNVNEFDALLERLESGTQARN